MSTRPTAMIPHKAEALAAIEAARALLRREAPLTDLERKLLLTTLDHAYTHCEAIDELRRARPKARAGSLPETIPTHEGGE